MRFNNLGYQTDWIFSRFDGLIKDRVEYCVIETPSNPHFHWGNYLFFPHAPQKGDYKLWTELFRKEFSHQPLIKHLAFGWDENVPGDQSEFLQNGYDGETGCVVLSTSTLQKPPRWNSEISCRPLQTEQDWSDAFEIQIACRDEGHNEVEFRKFKEAQKQRYQAMEKAALGHWYGAFLGGTQIANLGIFCDGSLARYQNVMTSPEFRKKGAAATLVYEAGKLALEKVEKLVIVADELGGPRRVYEAVGFKPVQKQYGVSYLKR